MADKEYGDFEEIKEEQKKHHGVEVQNEEIGQYGRIKLPNPKRNEFLGIVVQRLGGNRMDVKTTDGKTRNCRVPGRFKRRFWLRPGDIIIIIPWEHDDSKGDIVFQYKKGQKFQLKKRGLLNDIYEGF